MDERLDHLFPIVMLGRHLRGLVDGVDEPAADAQVQVCADGTILVRSASDAMEPLSVKLTAEQMKRALQSYNALRASILPPR